MCNAQLTKFQKKSQAFNDFESEVDLQELNGINMGRILHSVNACTNTVNHIASEMKKVVIKNIIEAISKISLIIIESTTINLVSSLIIYLKTILPEMNEPTIIFIDIVELRDLTAEGIYKTMMNSLKTLGFLHDFLKENFTAIATDVL